MKPKDPVWNFYSALDDEKKTIRCLDCNAEVSAKVLRLRTHCEKCPELIKNKTKSKPVKRPYDQIGVRQNIERQKKEATFNRGVKT